MGEDPIVGRPPVGGGATSGDTARASGDTPGLPALRLSADAAARRAGERAEMVDQQLRSRGIRDERVLRAMEALPRELFVAEQREHLAYADGALPIDAGQTISQPYVVALMTERLAVRPGDRVLEIGTGSGYQSAVLALLGGRVVSYERHQVLAASARQLLNELGLGDRVDVRVGDGSIGDPAGGSWDRILVTAAAPQPPAHLLAQLADGGRLVVPVGPREHQELLLIERRGDEWHERRDGTVVFVPLVGEAGFPE